MIVGIGTDIVEVTRIGEMIERSPPLSGGRTPVVGFWLRSVVGRVCRPSVPMAGRFCDEAALPMNGEPNAPPTLIAPDEPACAPTGVAP